jgi:hypothetical protein
MANPVVWEMWKIVRDFMNLFFIFVLLMSAFYTIFQVDKYSYKNVLSKVIFGALFVNFSFPIARAIIDVGNVMMYSFITDIFGMTGGGLTGGILGTAGLADILVPKGFDKTYELKFYLIAIVCLFMFVVSFLTLALMMLFRLVMLPILVMFSPIGFVAGAIPGMDGYAKQWWDKLIKNVFFGPIAVFMMMISVKFLNVWGSSNAVKAGFSQAAVSSSDASGTLISGVVYMTIPVIFFWIAITSAESMSSQASGIANSFGSKFLKWAGGSALKFGGRKIERGLASNKYTKYLSPSVAIKAWTDRAKEHEEKDKEHLDLAAASMQDELNAGISRVTDGGWIKPGNFKNAMKNPSDRTNHAYAARAHMVAKAQKEASEISTNSEYLIKQLDAAIAKGDDTTAAGIVRALAKDNNLNDLMAARGAEYGVKMRPLLDKDGKPLLDKDGKPRMAPVVSPENYMKLVEGVLKKSGMKEGTETLALSMLDISEVATAAGNYGAGGMIKYNTDTKEWEKRTPQEQAEWAAGKVKNLEAQKRQQNLHPDSMFEYYYDEKGDRHVLDLTDAGIEILKTFTAADGKHSDRTREDFKLGMHELMQSKGGPDSIKYSELIDSNVGAKAYAEAVEVHYAAKNKEASEKKAMEVKVEKKPEKSPREKMQEIRKAHGRG